MLKKSILLKLNPIEMYSKSNVIWSAFPKCMFVYKIKQKKNIHRESALKCQLDTFSGLISTKFIFVY